MASAKTRDDVFTLGPEMRADVRENDREAFAERLQRVARKMTEADEADEETAAGKDAPDQDEYPEALKGFTFHQQDHGKGMLFGVVAAPLAFVACVIGAVSILGPLGEPSPEGEAVANADKEQAVVAEADDTVLVAPPFQAITDQSSAVIEPITASMANRVDAEKFRAQNDWTINIPAGAAIEKIDLEQGQLAIHLEAEGQRSVLAYNTVFGQVTESDIASGKADASVGIASDTTSEFVSLVDEKGVLPPSLKTRL